MSYARFGQDGSDVYVYLDCGGWLACCGCSLHDEGRFDTTANLITHLELHKAAGHDVPDECIEALEAEAAENDAWIEEVNR